MPDVLYSFGWNLLVAGFMAVAVWLACRTRLLSRRPAVCHGLWLLVLLKLVTPPIVPVPLLPAIAASQQSSAAILPNTVQDAGCASYVPALICDDSTTIATQADELGVDSCTTAVETATELPSHADLPRDMGPLPWRASFFPLLGVSLFVSCALWIAAARQLYQVRKLLRGSAVESGRAAELLWEVARRFNSQTAVKLHLVDAPITPMLWAMPGNPVIVLPRQLVDSLNDHQLRSILAHELGHFMRRDHWANLFACIITTLFWWNPIVWFARRQLSAAAEACCDAVALERLHGSRKSYAQTLLTVVDSLTTTAPLRSALGIAFGESHSLRRRFEMIADADVKARMTPRGWMLLALGVAALTLVPARAEENSDPSAPPLSRLCCSQATAENGDAPVPATILPKPWGPEVGGFRCRLVAVPTDANDESPDPTKTIDNFARGEDVTFVVELKNVGEKPATLLGVRLGDSYGSAQGKLATASFAPHLFEFEFSSPDGTPVHRPKRVSLESRMLLGNASTREIEPGNSLSFVLRPAKFASPMDYQLSPGSYRATVRYRGPTEKMLACIKEIWPDKPQARAWTGEVASNEVTFNVADDPDAPQPAELHWGEPNAGLRAAVEFQPRNGEGSVVGQRDAVLLNSALNVTVHLQNVSDQPISLASEVWRQGDRLTVKDETGKWWEVRGPWYSGGDPMVRWTLKPGEVADIQSAAIGVVANQVTAAQLEHPIGKTFLAKPGSYSLRYTVRLGNVQIKDGKGNVVLPGINDWQGELVTGETPLEVE